jgi:hypothetical protein
MLDWKIIKEKQLRYSTLRIYELPTGAFYVIESDNDDIIQARFHFLWSEALHDFNRIRKLRINGQSNKYRTE